MKFRRTALLLAALVACACSSDIILIKPTPPDSTGGGGGGGGGTLQRARLGITVRLTGEDSALAGAIGSPGGVLSNALVTIARFGSSFRQTDTADAGGVTVFDRLLPGDYTVSVIRILTAAEVAALGSGNEDVNAFGGGSTVKVVAPGADTGVVAVAGRRGSLVISEAFYGAPLVNGAVYHFAKYIELYNNSDTMIYLDGKLIGLGPGYIRDYSNSVFNRVSCEEGAPYQLDPDGIWSRYIWRVPGSGRDHSLGPGGAVVLAADAVDHTAIDSRLPDLSRADFEFIGSTDADNPAAPNLIDVGTKEFVSVLGRGLLVGFPGIYYIADTLDLSSLPTARLPTTVELSLRIPRGKVLDVFASALTPSREANQPPMCAQWISPVFDRQPAGFFEELTTNTAVRRVFTSLPDGRVILLRTKTTANDFVVALNATPGVVP